MARFQNALTARGESSAMARVDTAATAITNSDGVSLGISRGFSPCARDIEVKNRIRLSSMKPYPTIAPEMANPKVGISFSTRCKAEKPGVQAIATKHPCNKMAPIPGFVSWRQIPNGWDFVPATKWLPYRVSFQP